MDQKKTEETLKKIRALSKQARLNEKIDGEQKDDLRKHIESNPKETVSLLRNWLRDSS